MICDSLGNKQVSFTFLSACLPKVKVQKNVTTNTPRLKLQFCKWICSCYDEFRSGVLKV